MSLNSILDEVRAEREYQDSQWGTEFDDKNTLNDWLVYIAMYASQAARMDTPPVDQRKNMLKVAALAVAAIEAFDRNGQFAPRHYEDRVPAGTRPGINLQRLTPNEYRQLREQNPEALGLPPRAKSE